MNKSFARGLMAAFAFVLLNIPGSTMAQGEVPESSETALATIEGPLSREGLNEVRLSLAEEDIKFNYKKRAASDALMMKEHKIDSCTNIKATKRLTGTWRLKQKNVDTSKIMKEYGR